MGTYCMIVNLTKKECLDPHTFGDGAKITEFGFSRESTMTALAFLLADCVSVSNWGGDKIMISNDDTEFYFNVCENYKDISEDVLKELKQDWNFQKE